MNPDHPELLVIIGAGASYDSADGGALYEDGNRFPAGILPPPLAVNLVSFHFDHISQQFPPAQAIIDKLRRRIAQDGTTSLETELAQLADDGSPERRAQMMAFRFYLQRVVEQTAAKWLEGTYGYTRYVTLFDEIAEWQREAQGRVNVVTFNYDTLIEAALERTVPGWTFSGDLQSYVSRNDFRLFKLHGSTDWSRVFSTDNVQLDPLVQRLYGSSSLQSASGHPVLPLAMELAAQAVSVSGRSIESTSVTPTFAGRPELLVPALAVPIAGKMDFECPDEHIKVLTERLPQITHVLIIGWRGAEQHAIELLDGRGQPDQGLMPGYALGLVSGDADGISETAENLAVPGRRGITRLTVKSGFKGLIDDEFDEISHFLRRSFR
jgi:hypothetical protein